MSNQLTIVFCYRNREVNRIRRSLDSLAVQDDMNFKVIFVDYGSDITIANDIEKLTTNYPFVTYLYNDTRFMPWNRSHALNSGILLATSDYIFSADVDMIFTKNFVSVCNSLKHPGKAFFFSVYYLPADAELENVLNNAVGEKSKKDALGLALVPRQALLDIGGYDEFYCFWGKEDNDIEQRLKVYGLDTQFYQDEVLMYHMHHETVSSAKKSYPKGWLIYQDNYLHSNRNKVVRNKGYQFGKVFERDERLCVKMIYDNATEYIYIEGKSDFFNYVLNYAFNEVTSGQTIALFFRDEISVAFEKSRLNKTIAVVNNIFKTFNFPAKLSSIYLENYEDIYDCRDTLIHFLSCQKSLISDFAFAIRDKEMRIVILKK